MQGRVLFLIAGLALSPVHAFAGFGFDSSDQAINISNNSSAESAAASKDGKQGAQRPQSDPQAPALQVYQERYIPDSVRKKYNLQDSWYDGAPRTTQFIVDDKPRAPEAPHEPVALAPADMALPPEEQVTGAAPPAAPAQPVISSAAYTKVESWRARKGETVRAVLKRWSDRSGTDMLWASGSDPVLPKDFSYVGTMADAVAAVMRSTGTELYSQYRADGLNPVMATPASTITSNAPALAPTEPDETVSVPYSLVTPEAKSKSQETRWFALSGASLREVLQVWAEDEGAALVWQVNGNVALKDSVSRTGRFEDAVLQVLSQYNQDHARPIGQLYSDPASGRKVLVVKTETPS